MHHSISEEIAAAHLCTERYCSVHDRKAFGVWLHQLSVEKRRNEGRDILAKAFQEVSLYARVDNILHVLHNLKWLRIDGCRLCNRHEGRKSLSVNRCRSIRCT